ncbi:MAG: hypothetical protein HY290_01090 [Planctomycetia bacterium]|nr:hypothetical protein [Planctomycetia bacterium]
MRDFRFSAIEFETAGDALQHTEAAGGEAILLDARNFVVTRDEAIYPARVWERCALSAIIGRTSI